MTAVPACHDQLAWRLAVMIADCVRLPAMSAGSRTLTAIMLCVDVLFRVSTSALGERPLQTNEEEEQAFVCRRPAWWMMLVRLWVVLGWRSRV